MKHIVFFLALITLSASAGIVTPARTINCNFNTYSPVVAPTGKCPGDRVVTGVQDGKVYCSYTRVYCFGALNEPFDVKMMTDEEEPQR